MGVAGRLRSPAAEAHCGSGGRMFSDSAGGGSKSQHPHTASAADRPVKLCMSSCQLDPIPDGGSQPEGAAASFTDLVSAAAREQTEALQLLVCALAGNHFH